MSDESDEGPNISLKDAIEADDPETQRKFLIRMVVHINNRLDNGLSDRVEKNTEFRERMTRGFWVSFPIMLAIIGFLIQATFL